MSEFVAYWNEEPPQDYLAFHAWTGHTLGYVRNAANRRVAAECAWQQWGGLTNVAPADLPFDWRDRELTVIDAPHGRLAS